jgi:anaerobic magnesium-protoporphyrin IX monomethyl ester cyclase
MNRLEQPARVLLTHSNHVFYDDKQREKMEPYPPLQTLLAAAVLQKQGVRVELCDITLSSPKRAIEDAISRFQPTLFFVCEDDFNFLTKMCLSRNRELAFWSARVARKAGCVAIVHGSDAADHTEDYLRAGFSCVLVGEVENTLRELISGSEWDSISGLAYMDQAAGTIARTSSRILQNDLDSLPDPAWDLIDLEPYRRAWLEKHGYFSLNLVSSRGCPYRCNWCAKPTYGSNYHVQSPRRVAEQMLQLKQRFAPDRIWFADDIFSLSPRWTKEFANVVCDLSAVIPFKMQSRCDLMTRESVADLKRAGCTSVWMGAESGSQRILDAMEKGTAVPQILSASDNLRRNGITVGWFLQFGYPGERWDDIERTIAMVRQGRPNDIGISVSYPLPGTKFFQIVSSQLGSQKNWSESGDLAMMFRGAFSTDLYRALAHALHLEIRMPKASSAIERAWSEVYSLRNQELFSKGVAV